VRRDASLNEMFRMTSHSKLMSLYVLSLIIYLIIVNYNNNKNIDLVITKFSSTSSPDGNNNDIHITNPYQNWCPNAVCAITRPQCHPCKRRYLFVLPQKRSRWLQLQKLVNILPGVRIRGTFTDSEFLETMAKLFTDLTLLQHEDIGLDGVFGHHPYHENHLLCASQTFIEELDPPKSVKEYDTSNIVGIIVRPINEYTIKFLVNNFPCSKFIFNIRSKNEINNDNNNTDATINDSERVLDYHNKVLEQLGSNRVYLMEMKEWSEDAYGYWHFTKLAKWLGYKNCKYTKRIENSYDEVEKTVIDIGENCYLD